MGVLAGVDQFALVAAAFEIEVVAVAVETVKGVFEPTHDGQAGGGGPLLEWPADRVDGVMVERDGDLVAVDAGGEREPAHCPDRTVAVGAAVDGGAERVTGVAAVVMGGPVDGGVEVVPAGRYASSDRIIDTVDLLVEAFYAFGGGGDLGGDRGVFGAPPGGEALVAGEVGLDGGVFQDERVPGGERFHFPVGEGGDVGEVVDGAGTGGVGEELPDEPGFAFQGLP